MSRSAKRRRLSPRNCVKDEKLFSSLVRAILLDEHYNVDADSCDEYHGKDGPAAILKDLAAIPRKVVRRYVERMSLRTSLPDTLPEKMALLAGDTADRVVRAVFRKYETTQNFGKKRMVEILAKRIVSGKSSHVTERFREAGVFQDVRRTLDAETRVFVLMHGRKSLAKDVMLEIFSFLPRTYSVICSVGCVSNPWYYLLMSTWNEVVLTDESNVWAANLFALRSAKTVRVSSTKRFSDAAWLHLASHISPRKLDCGAYAATSTRFSTRLRFLVLFQKRTAQKNRVNCMRSLEHLVLPHIVCEYSMMMMEGAPIDLVSRPPLPCPPVVKTLIEETMNTKTMRDFLPRLSALDNIPFGCRFDAFEDTLRRVTFILVTEHGVVPVIPEVPRLVGECVCYGNSPLDILVNWGEALRQITFHSDAFPAVASNTVITRQLRNLERVVVRPVYGKPVDLPRGLSAPTAIPSVRVVDLLRPTWSFVKTVMDMFPNLETAVIRYARTPEVGTLRGQVGQFQHAMDVATLIAKCKKVRISSEFVTEETATPVVNGAAYFMDMWSSSTSGIVTVRIYESTDRDEFRAPDRMSSLVSRVRRSEHGAMNAVSQIVGSMSMQMFAEQVDWWKEIIFSSPLYSIREVNEAIWNGCLMVAKSKRMETLGNILGKLPDSEWITLRGFVEVYPQTDDDVRFLGKTQGSPEDPIVILSDTDDDEDDGDVSMG